MATIIDHCPHYHNHHYISHFFFANQPKEPLLYEFLVSHDGQWSWSRNVSQIIWSGLPHFSGFLWLTTFLCRSHEYLFICICVFGFDFFPQLGSCVYVFLYLCICCGLLFSVGVMCMGQIPIKWGNCRSGRL